MKVKIASQNSEYSHHTDDFLPDKEYLVLAIEGDNFRILSQEGPCLYPREIFEILDAERPADWITEQRQFKGKDKVFEFATPPELIAPFSFEAYFDRVPDAVSTFNKYLEKLGLPVEMIVTKEGKVKRIRPLWLGNHPTQAES